MRLCDSCPFLSFKRRTDGLVEPTPGIVAAGGGLVFTPGVYTSTSWDGDAKDGDSGIIDLSAVFGVPAGVKAVSVNFYIKDETVGVYVALYPPGGHGGNGMITKTQVANVNIGNAGIVPCDTNGDIYFLQNGELDAVSLYITGYWS